jgi:hypothetical protein
MCGEVFGTAVANLWRLRSTASTENVKGATQASVVSLLTLSAAVLHAYSDGPTQLGVRNGE